MYAGNAVTSSRHTHVTCCSLLRRHARVRQCVCVCVGGGGNTVARHLISNIDSKWDWSCKRRQLCPPLIPWPLPVAGFLWQHRLRPFRGRLDVVKARLHQPPNGLGLSLQHVQRLLQTRTGG